MPRNLLNQRIGRLLVIEYEGKAKNRHPMWKCLCTCGKMKTVSEYHLVSEKTLSCGCLNREINASMRLKHGDSRRSTGKSKLYMVWVTMRKRCNSETDSHYAWYGAKGITVCDEWQEFEAFKRWALSNGYEEGLSIDRLDSTKGYSPENCQFITQSENSKKILPKRSA